MLLVMKKQPKKSFKSLCTLVLILALPIALPAAAEDLISESIEAASRPSADWSGVLYESQAARAAQHETPEHLLRRAAKFSRSREFSRRVAIIAPRDDSASAGRMDLARADRSGVRRFNVDHRTRLTGWQLRDHLYFGRSKGKRNMQGKRELSGVALIWQPSQTQQVSLSGKGLKLTRRFGSL